MKNRCGTNRKAEYRRIHKNFKSLGKYKAEQARRGKILELQDEGLTIRQIAGLLGVSERTIKRDLAKLRFRVNRHQSQELSEMGNDFRSLLRELESSSEG